jgi:hypothetical protein
LYSATITVGHAIFVERVLHRLDHAGTVEADVEIDRSRALEQPVHVGVEADQLALDQAQAFPHAVAQSEARVKDGDHGLVAWEEGAVHIDQHAVVAGIGLVGLGAGLLLALFRRHHRFLKN